MLEECERYLTLSHVGIKGLMGSAKFVQASHVYNRVREMVEGLQIRDMLVSNIQASKKQLPDTLISWLLSGFKIYTTTPSQD